MPMTILNSRPDLLLTASMDLYRQPSFHASSNAHVVPWPPSSRQHEWGIAATLRSVQSFGPSTPQQRNCNNIRPRVKLRVIHRHRFVPFSSFVIAYRHDHCNDTVLRDITPMSDRGWSDGVNGVNTTLGQCVYKGINVLPDWIRLNLLLDTFRLPPTTSLDSFCTLHRYQKRSSKS